MTPRGRGSLHWTLRRVAVVALVGAFLGALIQLQRADSTLISFHFMAQDGPALLIIGLVCIVMSRFLERTPPRALDRRLSQRGSMWFICIAAVVVSCVIILIRRFTYHDFALSLDEFMADFDARIFVGGRMLAPVAPEWREFVPALQPIFRLAVPEDAYIASSYLPGNAILRAGFILLGDGGLAGVVLAVVALVALYGVARSLWPDRPDAAAVSVVFLAASSQFLVTAATPYAMTAHLALNLTWLWLFLRDTRSSHGLAGAVAFVACGLHQVVFHPLFTAPFVISLVVKRRWKTAAFYGVVYAASAVFWILYGTLLLRGAGAVSADSASVGLTDFSRRVTELIDPSFDSVALMLLNLFRFLAWQSPLVVPLALFGLRSRGHRNVTVTCLLLGIAVTLAVAFAVLPFQGHGWGYRYLHGTLGSLSLIAAQGWIYATKDVSGSRVSPRIALLTSVACSLFVLLPWHLYQVHTFVSPYASASRAIERASAEVVVVDDFDIWYGSDLVRNDPFLRASPKVVSLRFLDERRLRALCGRSSVAIFDRDDALSFGLRIESMSEPVAARQRLMRDVMASIGCGA